MNASQQALATYIESLLLQWHCSPQHASAASQAMVVALTDPGHVQQGWTQSVEHLALARLLGQLRGDQVQKSYVQATFPSPLQATAIALARLDRPVIACATLLDSGILQKHAWCYSGLREDWTLDLRELVQAPEALELGTLQALRQTLEFIAPAWDIEQGRGQIRLLGLDQTDLAAEVVQILAKISQDRGWNSVPKTPIQRSKAA